MVAFHSKLHVLDLIISPEGWTTVHVIANHIRLGVCTAVYDKQCTVHAVHSTRKHTISHAHAF